MKPIKFLPEEHQLMRELRASDLKSEPFLLAVSGGVDSMVLLQLFARLRPLLARDLAVVHIHHGPVSLPAGQKAFRDRAQGFVKRACAELNIRFFTRRSRRKLMSENDCREFRYQAIEEVKAGWRKDALTVTAHHRDDLLETQLLRLIRGTSLTGLRGIEFLRAGRLRPLLIFSSAEVRALAKKLKIKHCQDPSNQSIEPMRNWLRQKWLPELERKSRGATKSLARSLATIAREASGPVLADGLVGIEKGSPKTARKEALSRPKFIKLGREQQRKVIAHYIVRIGISDYRQSQIDELIRRLDNRRVEFTFSLLKHQWRINAEQIKAVKLRS